MRIIAGRFRGRQLRAPAGQRVRPTSDSLRETLFNVLGDAVEGARVLDAFAGTGALGLEALSRGAREATFVERDPAALRALQRNIDACGVEDACVIIRGDFPIALRRRRAREGVRSRRDRSAEMSPAPDDRGYAFDLILLDPPYEIADVVDVVAGAAPLVAPHGRVVLEHSRRRPSPEAAGLLRRTRVLTAGDSALSWYAAGIDPEGLE
jgi:16S rRNA (guanine966-N2)-methyltransferase